MHPGPLFQRGLELLKAGKHLEAQKVFAENETHEGTSEETQALIEDAEALLAAGDYPAAASAYESVLDRNPGRVEAYLGLTRLGLFSGQAEDARVHAVAATQLAPTLPHAWTLLGLVHEATGQDELALELLRKGARLGADSFLCQYNLGRFLVSKGRAEEALAPLERGAALQPDNPDVHAALGHALRRQGQYEAALRTFERARDLSPSDVEAWGTLADVLYEVREFEAARAIVDRGLAACGDHPVLLEKGVACALVMDDPAGAAHYVERELAVVPDHEQGWVNLVGLYAMCGDLPRAEAVAKTFLQKFPDNWEGWLLLADLHDGRSDDAQAEPAYRRALALAPEEWKVLGNFGAFLVQSASPAHHAEAKGLLEHAAKRAPRGEFRPRYNLALAHVRLKNPARALELTRELMKEVPADAPLYAEVKKLESNLLEKRA
jgi:tetratricopeptide (TPR) repeat protein